MTPLPPASHSDNMTIVAVKRLVSNSFYIEQGEDLGASYDAGLNSSLLLPLLKYYNHLVITEKAATPRNPTQYVDGVILVPWAPGSPFSPFPLLSLQCQAARAFRPELAPYKP